MTAPATMELYVVLNALIVLALGYCLVKFSWNQPLRNGAGFFMGIEVPTDFYRGRGRTWLRSYRATLVAVHIVLLAALGASFVFGRPDLTPIWAGGWAILYTATMTTFAVWTRRKLGANPPVRPVALALESRRLGDYIFWPLEGFAAALVLFSWWVQLRQDGAQVHWLTPLELTWIALGLFVMKIAAIRTGYPLPAERTEEHYRYQDALRRNSVRTLSAWSWFIVIVLLGTTLRRLSPLAWTAPGLWFTVAVFLVAWGYGMLATFRGQRLAATMGRDLRPAGSFATPYRRAIWTSRSYLAWFAIWFGVLMVLVCFSIR
jgi:hypothetical protein